MKLLKIFGVWAHLIFFKYLWNVKEDLADKETPFKIH